jgi:hypothetical protein
MAFFVRKHKKAPEQSGLCSSHRKKPSWSPAERVRLGEEEQGSGRMAFFCAQA